MDKKKLKRKACDGTDFVHVKVRRKKKFGPWRDCREKVYEYYKVLQISSDYVWSTSLWEILNWAIHTPANTCIIYAYLLYLINQLLESSDITFNISTK